MSHDDNFFDHLDEMPKVEFIPPSQALKKKAGSGGIPDHLVERGESFIKDNNVDFIPFAKAYIEDIRIYIEQVKKTQSASKQKKIMHNMTLLIMQLKAHGGMFNYPSMSLLSNLILKFLEKTDLINDDLIKIIEAHNNGIDILINGKVKIENDVRTIALEKELQKVIDRYLKKYT